MSIEKNIERIANAIEALVEMKSQQPLDFTELKQGIVEEAKVVEDKPKATKPKETKVDKPAKTEEKDESPLPSVEDIRKVATSLVKGGGKSELATILEELGADNLSSIAPADRPQALEKLEAAAGVKLADLVD